ncbi:LANO_0H21924g1_1 [Lachancea nothofagi CBS 11611]|uniref:LANO_0H21924g1_1 n=1 Tax=Lachancea nothofagi CBS 11611 TaxID=1266666 RepID=A0A1G4KNP5_9SACH|nr:LANO_0H21924g1_1 [Lachancea nothofagi CBS 11611]
MGNSPTETPTCVRCKGQLVMGHAYELGGDRWHTHCFSCYKCEKPLSCDSNFLVLGTGALICYTCSDSCKSCGKKIDDLAIILASSNEAYCSECFKCCKCECKIDDLRYAKTKRGLFCIGCHERLLEKRKNYEERKRRLKKQLPLIPPSDSNPDLSSSITNPDVVVPERSTQRPLSPIKDNLRYSAFSREDTSLNSSPNIVDRPVSSASSITVPLDFSAATSASGEPLITAEKHDASEFATNNSTIRSNSESVVAQFLLDGDYMSTADEESVKPESGETSIEPEQVAETTTYATPRKTHKSQLSIDDMLQTTLENDEYQDEDTEGSINQFLELPKEQKKVLLNRTPLRNSNEDVVNRSPVAYRQGLVLDEEDVMNTLNSPVKVEPKDEPKSPGLGILARSNSRTPSTEDEPIGVCYDSMPSKSDEPPTSEMPQSPPIFGHHKRSSSGNAKKLGRSLSLRSKSIMMNLRPKSKDTRSNGQPFKSQDHDTHSGWGVASHAATKSPSSTERATPKHSSDSTIYPHARGGSSDLTQHIRSNSGTAGVSVYRTPPLDTQSSFIKSATSQTNSPAVGNTQIEERDEDNDATPTNDDFLRKDLLQMELSLRRLKLEVNQLNSQKSKLVHDVDSLKSTKESLQGEIRSLRSERGSVPSGLESSEYLEHDNFEESGESHAATANVVTTAKPKFWKLFSGKPNPGYTNGQNKLDISPPVLQNPNEFEDMKMLPVKSESRALSASPPAKKDGASLYGSTLISRCVFEQSEIPMIMNTCIRHIESKEAFLKSDGLYRKSGSQVLIEQIESEFARWQPNKPISDQLEKQLNQDIHAVSGVLKRYLRKLPNPVFTFQVYEPLMEFVRENNLINALPLKASSNTEFEDLLQNAVEQLCGILQQLPQQHYSLLKVLVQHIDVVARYSDYNLMNLHNLSLVFAPGIIRDYSGEKDITDMRERNYLVSFVLANYRQLFR